MTAGKPETLLVCRQCASEALDELGVIPPASVFAGQLLEPHRTGRSLYLYRHCHLALRHPIESEEDYERLYGRASVQVWLSCEPSVNPRLVLDRIKSDRTVGSVLDIGCYDGALLAALLPRFSKYGIEASAAAAPATQQKGIEIRGTRIRDIPAIDEKFDVVCAIDVVEHLAKPRDLLATLFGRLLPTGTLFISTGDAHAPAWRLGDGLHWYCSSPRHASFSIY